MTNLDSIINRDITFSTKVYPVKAMTFPIIMYGYESWSIKRAEPWRIDAFELWDWRTLLRVPWTARRSNQSILEEISPGCSLEGLMLKLKLQYLIGKDPGARKDWGQEKKGTTEDEIDDITDTMDMSLGKLLELVMHREAWHAAVLGVAENWTHLSDWTEQISPHLESQLCPMLWKHTLNPWTAKEVQHSFCTATYYNCTC